MMDQRGWICPLCSKALAPWVSECGCYRTVTQSNVAKTMQSDSCGSCGKMFGDLSRYGCPQCSSRPPGFGPV